MSWAFYIEGYQAIADAVAATGHCPKAPPDCPLGLAIYPCVYDPSRHPDSTTTDASRDNPRVMRDYGELAATTSTAAHLPQVVFVRGLGYHSEHPGAYDTISDGTRSSAG